MKQNITKIQVKLQWCLLSHTALCAIGQTNIAMAVHKFFLIFLTVFESTLLDWKQMRFLLGHWTLFSSFYSKMIACTRRGYKILVSLFQVFLYAYIDRVNNFSFYKYESCVIVGKTPSWSCGFIHLCCIFWLAFGYCTPQRLVEIVIFSIVSFL